MQVYHSRKGSFLRYLYNQSQYPNPWTEKCHIPIAQELEH